MHIRHSIVEPSSMSIPPLGFSMMNSRENFFEIPVGCMKNQALSVMKCGTPVMFVGL